MRWADLMAAFGQRFNWEGIVCFSSVLARDQHLLLPHVAVRDVRQIDWPELQRRGFKGVVFDKDNTITAPYSLTLWGPIASSIEQCKSVFGHNIAIFSNSAGLLQYDHNGAKATALEWATGIKVIRHKVKKPAGAAEEIERHFGCDSSQLIMVGDRPFTDIVYGNRNGFLTVLVEPLSRREESFIVRQVRKLESAIVSRWSRKGLKPNGHRLLPNPAECVKESSPTTLAVGREKAMNNAILLFPVICSNLEDQKTYNAPPDPPSTPVYGSPPQIVSPPRGRGGSPHHHHHHPPPSPPTNCGTPPSSPTPSRPSTPPSGGYYSSPPPTPVYVSPPSTPTPIDPVTPTPIVPITPPTTPTPSRPSTPPSGGYYSSPPPTPVYVSPPSTPTPIVPITPTTPSPFIPVTPTTPSPFIPVTPTTPTIPLPPFPFDPNSPFGGGTCNFWRNNPPLIWGLVGWYAPLGPSLGIPSTPGFPTTMNPLQALSNPRTDGYGELYREGTASFLNSMVNHRFPFTTTQVRNSFVAALGSDKAAGAQARVFRMANEGHLKPRA